MCRRFSLFNFKQNSQTRHCSWPVLIQLSQFILKCALLILIIPLFVPFTPKMPAPGVDASWALGLNQAVAQGLSFGKQIIFTLGPYSSIYTKAYHPATDLMMMGGSFYWACTYWFALILLMKGNKWQWNGLLSIFLLTMVYAKDALFFSYPILVGLIIIRRFHVQEPPKRKYLILSLILLPLGLLPLIKGSLLILCMAAQVLFILIFTVHKQKISALLCFVCPFSALLIFWLIAGQSILDIPAYLMTSLELAAEFSEAMANEGNKYELIAYLLASSAILALLIYKKQSSWLLQLFIFSLFFIFLFLSFKTGFTRHFGHALIAGTAILLAALLLPYCIKSRGTVAVILCTALVSVYINGQYTHISLLNNLKSTYVSAWYGAKSRFVDPTWVKQNFIASMRFLRAQYPLPSLAGSADIYSYEQSALIAAGLTWSPRPIFQSYSVFNPSSAKTNVQHLLSVHPEHIIFKMQAIDGRIPAIEDGLSWPVLLHYYQPVQWSGDFLILQHKHDNRPMSAHSLSSTATHQFGETVMVPKSHEPIFIQLEINPTFWGILAGTFFKLPTLYLNVELVDGSKKSYRLPANMARAGFLLSPLIEITQEFALLYQQHDVLQEKQVHSFVIVAEKSNFRQWRNNYTIELNNLQKI